MEYFIMYKFILICLGKYKKSFAYTVYVMIKNTKKLSYDSN